MQELTNDILASSQLSAIDHSFNSSTIQDELNILSGISYSQLRGYSGNRTHMRVYGRDNLFDGAMGDFYIDVNDEDSNDDDGIIIVDKLSRRWKRHYSGNVNAAWYGVMTNSDITEKLQRAIDTRKNVDIPAGNYTSTDTFYRYSGQIISGAGIPERSIASVDAITTIEFVNDVDGFSNVKNIALGGGIRNLYLIAPNGSTKTGILDGIIGELGGRSQSIACLHENLFISNFYNGVQIAGWCWETTLRRIHVDGFTDYGIAVYDASNAVSIDNCSAISSAEKPQGARCGFLFSGGACITLTTPRSENNRIGFIAEKEARVNLVSPYSEGNRDIDFDLHDDFTSMSIINAVALHTNDNVITTAIFRVNQTCGIHSSLVVNGIKVKVSKGEPGLNNELKYFYVGESDVYASIQSIDWWGDGKLWASFSGRFSPTEMTFVNLPGVIFRRYEHFLSTSTFYGYSGSIAPTNPDYWILKNYDGSSIDLRYPGSRVICNIYDADVDYWIWTGNEWKPKG